jgi:uncharacterized protein DUF3135
MIPEPINERKEFSHYTPDELRELYKIDPGQFEELAAEAINQACMGSTPAETIKLRQLQWRIDAHLQTAKTPLERMQIMENIFYDQVFGDDGELAHLVDNCVELARAIGAENVPARKPVLYLVKR